MKKYTITFHGGRQIAKLPAKTANQAKILAQGAMIAKGWPYAVKRVELCKEGMTNGKNK